MAVPFPKPYQIFLNISSLFLLSFLLKSDLISIPHHPSSLNLSASFSCAEFEALEGRAAKCSYLETKANPCSPRGYVDYLRLFYCVCGDRPLLGYAALALCLLLLFYLLGSTASIYFCPSLESLSRILGLPPTVAGVTLLSLGNGAPDAFSTIASFAGGGPGSEGDLGLSSVLGGAFFVTSAVVGLISLCVAGRSVAVDRFGFVREICFLVLVLCFLLAVLIAGEIGVPAAILFALLYIAYIAVVAASYRWRKIDRPSELIMPLLETVEIEIERPPATLLSAAEQEKEKGQDITIIRLLLHLLELPLYFPRRITIPDVSEERWSKPFAVMSVVFAPILLAALWSPKSLTMHLFGALVGLVLGMVASETTERGKAPYKKKLLLPWLAGGFLMSVVWFYITAGELVSLLVSAGRILGIGPSILAATVLAWGNSVGDLIANVAMAVDGGEDGVQIAISGCYAVPIFNTLVGLGLSLVFASWAARPRPYVIPQDKSLLLTLGFLLCGLLWALVMLPKRGMKLDRVFGVGLLALYCCFLCLRICDGVGLVQIDDLFRL